jgi:hypothetical protein
VVASYFASNISYISGNINNQMEYNEFLIMVGIYIDISESMIDTLKVHY